MKNTTRGVQINAFLLGLVKTVELAARTLWTGEYQLLVQALEALGVEGWAKRGGVQEQVNAIDEEDSSSPAQARCVRGPHCVQISDAGHSGKVRVASTKCGLCTFNIKRVGMEMLACWRKAGNFGGSGGKSSAAAQNFRANAGGNSGLTGALGPAYWRTSGGG